MTSTWAQNVQVATVLRHRLHRSPELSWQEHGTAQMIRAELSALNISWRACANTGTVATLAPNATGRHIALRGDIDALPITEQTAVDWISQTPGVMHACGHDGHTATLMAVARWLKTNESALAGPVSLLFQPAEEGGHGARVMIEDGALDGVDWIFGWHNWPAISFGRAVCPDGPVMAANGIFEIELTGRGGHASQPELCRDPVVAAAALTLNLQQIVARRLAPQSAAVVSVTSIDAPSGITVIPQTARLAGSIRVGDTAVRAEIGGMIGEIAQATAQSYGVQANVTVTPRYQATVNHAAPAAHYRDALERVLGPHWCDHNLPIPIMASEDFSYYLEQIPGAFALIGADDGQGHHVPCHSPQYDFNDRLIDPVGRVLASLVGMPPECGSSGNDCNH